MLEFQTYNVSPVPIQLPITQATAVAQTAPECNVAIFIRQLVADLTCNHYSFKYDKIMIFYCILLWYLVVSKQGATLTKDEELLPHNLIDLNGVEQEFEDLKSELSEFNPEILEMNSKNGTAFADAIGNIVLGNIWRRQRGRTKSSNFPTRL